MLRRSRRKPRSRQPDPTRQCSVHTVGRWCHPVVVKLTPSDVERIPSENLRVPPDEFVAVWTAAERLAADDWYAVGVASTCRWLAGASMPSVPVGRREPAWAPLTHRQRRAHPELIEDEAAKVDRRVARQPRGLEGRPGWLEGIAACLDWAWRGSRRVPLEVTQADAG